MSDDLRPDGTPEPLGDPSDQTPGRKRRTSNWDERIDGAELERRIRERRRKNQQERQDQAQRRLPTMSLLRMGVTALAGMGFVGMTVFMTATAGAHDDLVKANNAEIAALSKQITDAESRGQAVPEAAVMRNSMTMAVERAQAVADLQNEMSTVRTSTADEESMVRYAQLTEDGERFFARPTLTGGKFQPQARWYQPHVSVVDEETGKAIWERMAPEDWTWKVVTTRNINIDGQVPVVWEARLTGGEQDGRLLAWATGVYDPGTNQFHTMRLGHTKEGYDRIGATTSPEKYGSAPGQDIPMASELLQEKAREALDKARAREQEDTRRQEAESEQAERQERLGAPASDDNETED